MDEAQLIERVQRGDAVAERQLFEEHVDRIYRLAFRMTGQGDLAEDFTQDTFIKAFDRIKDFRGDSSFSTWLHTVATRTILNGLRKVKRIGTREIELEEAATLGRSDNVADPDLADSLAAAIDRLPEHLRIVFVMHDVEGYKHEEIATALGSRAGTSKAQLSRARTRLRESLAAFAGEWAS